MSIINQFLQTIWTMDQESDYGLSEEKKIMILSEFTKELIRQSGEEIFKLEDIVQDESPKNKKHFSLNKKQKHKEISKKAITPKNSDEELKNELENFNISKSVTPRVMPSSLSIPKQALPPRFQYLRPTPTNTEIDLGKLNPFLKDPMVMTIETSGPGQRVFVTGTMGRKKTNVFLSKEEIDEIIKKFSETTKIPTHEGIFRVVAGKLIFSAIISQNVGSKFVIKKMLYNPYFMRK